MIEDDLIKCDKCGNRDTPDGFAYIGPKDRDDTECSPFAGLMGGWEQICIKCEQESARTAALGAIAHLSKASHAFVDSQL